MPSYAEWVTLQAQREQTTKDSTRAQRLAQQAVGKQAQALQTIPEWQVYEAHLKTLLDQDAQERDALLAALQSPILTQIEAGDLRVRLLYWTGRLEARRQDVELLPALAKRGQEATEALGT